MIIRRLAAALTAAGLLSGALALTAFAREEADPWAEDTDGETEWLEEAEIVEAAEDDSKKDGGEEAEEGTPQAILDAAELTPSPAQSSELQELVDEILEDILEEEMGTYEKVRACYDYVTSTVSYGSHLRNLSAAVGDTTCADIYARYGEMEGFGAVALSAKTGMCNAYASAFLLLARSIGLDGHLVAGQTGRAGGGYTYHEWAEIDIGEETFLFDPQLEQDLVQAGFPAYTVFCRTYDEVPGRYLRSYRKL